MRGEDPRRNRDDRAVALRRVSDVVDLLLERGSAVSRLDGSAHDLFPTAITRAEGEALLDWLNREGASCTLEIGLAYGVATLFVCTALLAGGNPAARHVALDPYQERLYSDCGLQFLEDAGVSGLVEFHAEESQLTLPRFVVEGRRFDAAFVDGDHRYDGIFLDLVYVNRLVRGRGIVFVDDYQIPPVARAVAYCTTNLGWDLEEISAEHELHQWVVLRTPPTVPLRDYEGYVEF